MTFDPQLLATLAIAAFVCEYVDAAIGMGYGTILTPVLILAGFDPLTVIPAVLLSQAGGGLSAAVFHHRLANASFVWPSRDSRIALFIAGCGIAATIAGSLIALNVPRVFLKTYLGFLVSIMGILILRQKQYEFSWKKITCVGLLSAFNKGLSGGGYGPVVTAGQILAGRDHKSSVGVTTLAEVPICLTGFLTYTIAKKMHGFPPGGADLIIALFLGAVLAAPLGALRTKIVSPARLSFVIGCFVLLLGILTLANALSP